MALINTSGRYIKLDHNGNFEIYTSEAARADVKNSVSAEIVYDKYISIINDLIAEDSQYAELRCYNPKEYYQLLRAWTEEYRNYEYALTTQTFDSTAEYPLMSQYYPDVAKTIPHLVASGTIGSLSGETTQEVYNMAKNNFIWGDTIDA